MKISEEAKKLIAEKGIDDAMSYLSGKIEELEMKDSWYGDQEVLWFRFRSLLNEVSRIKRLKTPHDMYAVQEAFGDHAWVMADRSLTHNKEEAEWHSEKSYADVVRETLNQKAGWPKFQTVREKRTEDAE